MKNLFRITGCFIAIGLILLVTQSLTAQAQPILKAYPAPPSVQQNTDFTVKVRQPGQPWQDLPEYAVMVDRVKGLDHSVEKASMAYFDFSGEVEVSVRFNKGTIST